MEPNPTLRHRISKSYLYASLLLILYVGWRSIHVGFTHDESLSYTLITGQEGQLYTANNHWLNTVLMYISSKVFGYSEFALRLPNVLSFILYLVFIHRIFRDFSSNAWPLVIAFPILLLNPFILDFFGLARGYGLGMAFFTAALYYLLAYFRKGQDTRHLVLLVLCSLCCIYSNYAFLIALLAMHGAAFCFYREHLQKLRQLIFWYAVEILLLVPAVLNILHLSKTNELYVGGENNVFDDTIKSILDFSFNFEHAPYDGTLVSAALLMAAAVSGLLFFRGKTLRFIHILIVLLLLIPTLLHHFMGMGYPKDRAAQYWMVIIGFFILFATDAIVKNKPLKRLHYIPIVCFCLLSVLQMIRFADNFNLDRTIIWQYDADVKKAMQTVEKQTGKRKQVSIGISWTLEPSINYYRETRHLEWLRPVTRDGVAGEYDFYLVFAADLPAMTSRTDTLARYRESQLYVLKRK